MTVQYNPDVLTGGPAVFFRLLLRWKGCVIKLIYIDFILFMMAYTAVSCTYRFGLSRDQQKAFESVVLYVFDFQTMIPISFILGFYVQLVFSRFWQEFNSIPWVYTPTLALIAAIHGEGRARIIRRTCVRYLNASLIIASSRLHVAAKKRFPTTQHLVQAGILTQRESDLINLTEPVSAQPFLPIVWTTAIAMRAENDGFIKNPHALVNLIQTINNFRECLLRLFLIDKICVPLVYTQVVTLAVYSYFVASIIGRQFILDTSEYSDVSRKDYYIPVYTILEFLIYMGWLKVAETLLNPMGEDDEDFDINAIIDNNWSYPMHIVDRRSQQTELVKDKFWDATNINLPHTASSKKLQSSHMLIGSAYNLDVGRSDNRRKVSGNINKVVPPDELLKTSKDVHENVSSVSKNDSTQTTKSPNSPSTPTTLESEAVLPVLTEVDEEAYLELKNGLESHKTNSGKTSGDVDG